MRQARSFVKKALRGRVLDPSMESGQLLLSVAESWRQTVLAGLTHQPGDARRLIQAGWERLCDDLLWGVDRNPLAPIAVGINFDIACDWYGLKKTRPKNLLTDDFIRTDLLKGTGGFAAIVNNPPWGEDLSQDEAAYLRKHYETCRKSPDSYLAYVEKCLDLLNTGGLYSLALPASVLTASKAKPLRRSLAEKTTLSRTILIPGEVFADAMTRSVVLIGCKSQTSKDPRCEVVDIEADATTVTTRSARATHSEMRRTYENGWMHLFPDRKRSESYAYTMGLKDAATICGGSWIPPEDVVRTSVGHAGQECSRLFAATLPFGYIPVIEPRAVNRWHIDIIDRHLKPDSLIDIDARHFPVNGERVLIRSIFGREKGLSAAQVAITAIPRRGTIAIRSDIVDCDTLAAILNSDIVDEWVQNQGCRRTKTGMWKISISELSELPIPAALVHLYTGSLIGEACRREVARLCDRIRDLSRQLAASGAASTQLFREQSVLDTLIRQLYEFDPAKCDVPPDSTTTS